MYKLVLIDDDRDMLDTVAAGFRDKGYVVYTLENGKNAVAFIKTHNPDCVVLDVMMPGVDGFTACENIRKASLNVPVIFLTGRITEDDKVKGLLLGADDYIEKPFSFRELEARVQVSIRRTQKPAPGKLSFPPLEIDIYAHKATCNGEDLELTKREYDILYLLATNGKDITTYKDIGMHVWGVYREPDRRSVMVNVSRLRRKMAVNPVTARMIETEWSVGYKFLGQGQTE